MNMCIYIYTLSKSDFLLRSGIFVFYLIFYKAKASVKVKPEETEIKPDTQIS